ncbi:fatty acyl-CoA reductase 2, chloroplastic-like [Rhodamnia argentea]|uniref:Fatty acyl-CoA reductase n=1 Tax=Rhodamnia argentea TaxID=178133 RepID=A0ABM3HG77_9MYRT|nr:fatty acyl-CoA reductase 2, chloroplastic-like [Rhodamnia argentea]
MLSFSHSHSSTITISSPQAIIGAHSSRGPNSASLSSMSRRNLEFRKGLREPSFGLQRFSRTNKRNMAVKDSDDSSCRDATAPSAMALESRGGIGIMDFLERRNYLVTSATGFLAKVLIEKMLRVAPDVGKIFVLIKAKDERAAMDRVKDEIIECELFKCLQQKYGDEYTNFMLSKLVPVKGDIRESNMGIADDLLHQITREVDVVINSAANTTWDERYDASLVANTIAPSRLLDFAKKCEKLKLFLHVSTTYVNGERPGILMEKAFEMGESRIDSSTGSKLDVHHEMKLASDLLETLPSNEVPKKLKDMGLARARVYGWQSTYELTKAMGEMMINTNREGVPIVIVRPSIIESTFQEPFPGWIQGNRVLDPLILSYGKGRLPGFLLNPDTIVDVVPADLVANAIIAAMAKHGRAPGPSIVIYHAASSTVNPLTLGNVFEYSCNHFAASPLTDNKGDEFRITAMEYFSSKDSFSSYIQKYIADKSGLSNGICPNSNPKQHSRLEARCKRMADSLIHLAKLYEPYMFYRGRFDCRNAQKLIEQMSMEERNKFPMDLRSINWEDYFFNAHIPGLKRHIFKKTSSS